METERYVHREQSQRARYRKRHTQRQRGMGTLSLLTPELGQLSQSGGEGQQHGVCWPPCRLATRPSPARGHSGSADP